MPQNCERLVDGSHFPKTLLIPVVLLQAPPGATSCYAASSTDKILPAGSLNQAMVGPFPREIPRASRPPAALGR